MSMPDSLSARMCKCMYAAVAKDVAGAGLDRYCPRVARDVSSRGRIPSAEGPLTKLLRQRAPQ